MNDDNNILPEDSGKPSSASEQAQSFYDRFAGLERAHGRFDIVDSSELKKKGRVSTIQIAEPAPATWLELWRQHLDGKHGLGVVPIRDGNTCVWGCIDVDIYDLDIKAFEHRTRDTPLVICRTKSGGVHAFLFASEAVPAVLMRDKLTMIRAVLGLKDTTEIFPKQSELVAGRDDTGNWLNMPYFGGDRTMRYCIKDGESLTPDEFLSYAADKALSRNGFETLAISVPEDPNNPFSDGPPCLQALAKMGIAEGSRNNGLYNIGVYLKKKNPENWEDGLEDANRRFIAQPLGHKEVAVVIKSLTRKNYNFKCKDQPICGHCDRKTCLTRKFGVSDGQDDMALPEGYPTIADALVYRARGGESQFFVHVNGQKVGPLTAEEMTSQRRFGIRITNDLLIFLPTIKDATYVTLINKLLASARTEELPEEATPKGVIRKHLLHFLTKRSFCEDPADLGSTNKSYWDKEKNQYWFKLENFQEYLDRSRCFAIRAKALGGVLRDLGVQDKNVLWPTGNGDEVKQRRLWLATDLEPRNDPKEETGKGLELPAEDLETMAATRPRKWPF